VNGVTSRSSDIHYDQLDHGLISRGIAMSSLGKENAAPSPIWIDPERKARRSYDLAMIVCAGLIAVGLIIAIYGLTASPGINPDELASMVAYP
jgi:hypothetical protein